MMARGLIADTERTDSAGTYSPWPPEAFDLFFEHVRVDLHLPVYSGLFTGQRKVDVLKMLRPKSDAAEMPIAAQKTSDKVPVQIHSEYRQLIAAAPVGLYVLRNAAARVTRGQWLLQSEEGSAVSAIVSGTL